MKPAFPAPSAFNASVILPLLPVFLLGAAILSGGKKTLVAEAARRDQTRRSGATESSPKGLPYGPFTITRTQDILFKDTDRGKDIPVTVTAPDSPGPFPLIIFSHSAGGDGTQSESLLRWWASHGYVVISPTHSDSIRWQQQRSDLCSPDGSDLEEGVIGLQNIVRLTTRDPQAGAQRARDISFILDSLGKIEEKIPSLAGKIDSARVGVAGNSLGAYTAELIGGATVSIPSAVKPLSFRDSRARAILQLSGQGTGLQGLTRESWKTVRLPMMTITGSQDRGSNGRGPEWKREPFTFSPASGNKYHVFIEGAHRGSFSGRFANRRSHKQLVSREKETNAADQRAIFSYTEQATLAFWDMTLKNQAEPKALLDKNAASIARECGVTATIDHK